jgi:hypothetical protein
MSRAVTFNLLKPLLPPKTAWDKIYDWVLGRARIVILITIILIALAFIAKVVVDTDAKNKDKSIDTLTTRLQFYATSSEPVFRTFSAKTDNYVKVWNGSSGISSAVTEIYSYIPDQNADITIKVDGDRVSIFGTENLDLLRQLESDLRASETFSSVVFSNLTLDRPNIESEEGEYVVLATIKNAKRESI